jgi:hypothetical protein
MGPSREAVEVDGEYGLDVGEVIDGEKLRRGNPPFAATVFWIDLIIPLSPLVCSRTLVKSRGWVMEAAIEAATPAS